MLVVVDVGGLGVTINPGRGVINNPGRGSIISGKVIINSGGLVRPKIYGAVVVSMGDIFKKKNLCNTVCPKWMFSLILSRSWYVCCT